MKTGIVYGSNGGSTKEIALKVQKILEASISNISDLEVSDMKSCDLFVFASSTWGMGELSDDWENNLYKLDEMNLEGKMIAFIGLGDQYTYGSTFCDALSIIYDRIKYRKISLLGLWESETYEYDESESTLDGKFLGLIIDEVNQSELTDERIYKWVSQ